MINFDFSSMSSQQVTIYAAVIQAVATLFIGFVIFLLNILIERSRDHQKNIFEFEIQQVINLALSKKATSVLFNFNKDPKKLFAKMKKSHGVPYFNFIIIRIKNKSPLAVEEPVLEVRLDYKSKILDYFTDPESRPGYEIINKSEQKNENILRIIPPYVNRNEIFSIYITATGNDSKFCVLDVFGKNLMIRPKYSWVKNLGTYLFIGYSIALFIFMIVMVITYK